MHPVTALLELAAWIPTVVGEPPVSDRGVAYDRQFHALTEILAKSRQPTFDQLGPKRARRVMNRQFGWVDVGAREIRTEDLALDPLPVRVRVYRPTGASPGGPALVYFHGGGFVIGGIASHDGICRYLARRAQISVISVDYRLAPEHPFPSAPEDAVAAFRWISAHARDLGVDAHRLAVGGDSAGANLAAVVCLEVRGADVPPPAFQLLVYPPTDFRLRRPSHAHFAESGLLPRFLTDWFKANYLVHPDQELDPRASPIRASDLSGLPPAHVVTAGFDPLRDEGEAYAHALAAAGGVVSLRCYESLPHGFFSLGGAFPAARHAVRDIADLLGARLAES